MVTGIFRAAAIRTWQKTFRRPVHLTFSLLQPMMWMLFFGFLMQRFPVEELPAAVDYTSFLLPGICAMTVLFGASQVGIGLIRDMQSGFLQRVLASPAPRWVLHAGKLSADGIRLLLQLVVVLGLGVLVGASVSLAVLPLLLALLTAFFFAVAFGSLSCFLALRSRKQETMAAFVHAVNMPVFFTSTALVPQRQMPEWLAVVAAWNPLTPTVEALRGALLFQTMPSLTSQVLPMLVLAVGLSALAIWEMRRGALISPWESR